MKKEQLKKATKKELQDLACLALGKILRLGSREYQQGDMKQVEECLQIMKYACKDKKAFF